MSEPPTPGRCASARDHISSASAFCIRPLRGGDDYTAIPTTPTAAKLNPLDETLKFVKQILKSLDEKFATLETNNEERCKRTEDLVDKMNEHISKPALVDRDTQTERDKWDNSTQTAWLDLGPDLDARHDAVETPVSFKSPMNKTPMNNQADRARPLALTMSPDGEEADVEAEFSPKTGSGSKKKTKKRTRTSTNDTFGSVESEEIDFDSVKTEDLRGTSESDGPDNKLAITDKENAESHKASKEEAKEAARQKIIETRKAQMEAEADGMDLIGSMTGARSLQHKMDEVAAKWWMKKYPSLSAFMANANGPLSEFVEHKLFKTTTNMLVFMNIGFIVIQSMHTVENAKSQKGPSGIFRIVDLFFSGAFTGDLFLRLIGQRMSFFHSKDKWWNYLDFCLVTGDIFNETMSAIMAAVGKDAPSGYLGTLRGAARASRAGRAARTLRVFRSVSFFTLPREVVAAFSAVPFMIFLYFFIALFFSLIFMQATVESFMDPTAEESDQANMNLYFGSVDSSLVSLFFTLLGGMDWIDIYRSLQATSPLYSTIFLVFAFFAIVAFMNAITAMCVQSCLARVAQNEVETRLESSVKLTQVLETQAKKDFFNPLAGRQEFVVTWGKMYRILDKPLVYGALDTLGLDLVDAQGIVKLLARADGAAVNMSEFARACVKFRRPVQGVDFLPLLLANKRIFTEFRDLTEEMRNNARQGPQTPSKRDRSQSNMSSNPSRKNS